MLATRVSDARPLASRCSLLATSTSARTTPIHELVGRPGAPAAPLSTRSACFIEMNGGRHLHRLHGRQLRRAKIDYVLVQPGTEVLLRRSSGEPGRTLSVRSFPVTARVSLHRPIDYRLSLSRMCYRLLHRRLLHRAIGDRVIGYRVIGYRVIGYRVIEYRVSVISDRPIE